MCVWVGVYANASLQVSVCGRMGVFMYVCMCICAIQGVGVCMCSDGSIFNICTHLCMCLLFVYLP